MHEDAHLEMDYEDRTMRDFNDEDFDVVEEDEEEMLQVTVFLHPDPVDHGSIVVFHGESTGEPCSVAVDHRPAQDIINRLMLDGESLSVMAPAWAVSFA